jgi:hypothetical protein
MVLIESDPLRRDLLAQALRKDGIAVVAVGSICELERWPQGDVVVTESRHFTAWWKKVGATHVVVMADSAAEGAASCRGGAAMWLARRCPPARLVAAAHALGVRSFKSFTPGASVPRLQRRDAALIH